MHADNTARDMIIIILAGTKSYILNPDMISGTDIVTGWPAKSVIIIIRISGMLCTKRPLSDLKQVNRIIKSWLF